MAGQAAVEASNMSFAKGLFLTTSDQPVVKIRLDIDFTLSSLLPNQLRDEEPKTWLKIFKVVWTRAGFVAQMHACTSARQVAGLQETMSSRSRSMSKLVLVKA